jgi:hypothetical protein
LSARLSGVRQNRHQTQRKADNRVRAPEGGGLPDLRWLDPKTSKAQVTGNSIVDTDGVLYAAMPLPAASSRSAAGSAISAAAGAGRERIFSPVREPGAVLDQPVMMG